MVSLQEQLTLRGILLSVASVNIQSKRLMYATILWTTPQREEILHFLKNRSRMTHLQI